jgi:sugar phosphate isomerase/epimerase
MGRVRLCYALRRGVYYPSSRDVFGEMPPREARAGYLARVRSLGFDGGELPVDETGDVAAARELGAELREAELEAVCIRAGGALAHPLAGPEARRRLECAIHYATWVGARVVNTALVSPPTHPGGRGHARQGEPVSQGASRTASAADFEATAHWLGHYGRTAAELGIAIAVEVHQGSIADNSAATLHLLDLVGLDNIGANPDLGNIYWHYEHPEETAEAAVVALAPRAVYWHCKNLRRVHVPELRRSFFLRVPLPDGEIDYRFALSTMLAAGYQGYLAVEGAREGDQLTLDGRSVEYVRGLLAELGQD